MVGHSQTAQAAYHGKSTSSTTKADSLRAVFAAIAMSAKQFSAVFRHVCGIQKLVAET